jgi:hypothetical protein
MKDAKARCSDIKYSCYSMAEIKNANSDEKSRQPNLGAPAFDLKVRRCFNDNERGFLLSPNCGTDVAKCVHHVGRGVFAITAMRDL